jgi:hypothetical protein
MPTRDTAGPGEPGGSVGADELGKIGLGRWKHRHGAAMDAGDATVGGRALNPYDDFCQTKS